MNKKLIFFIILISLFSKAQAAIVVQSIAGASFTNIQSANINVLQAWGSFSGPENDAEEGSYNSCNDTSNTLPFTGCSINRVNTNTVILISFLEDADFEGTKVGNAFYTVGVTNNVQLPISNVIPITGPNQLTTISFRWSDLCSAIGGSVENGKCNRNGVIRVFVGFDPTPAAGVGNGGAVGNFKEILFYIYTPEIDNSLGDKALFTSSSTPTTPDFACDGSDQSYQFGMCAYSLLPGDEKVSLALSNLDPDNLDPNDQYLIFNSSSVRDTILNAYQTDGEIASNLPVNYNGVYMVASTTSFQNAYPWLAEKEPEVLQLESPGTDLFREDTLTNLENGVVHYFRGGSIDIIGNVTMLFDDTIINAYCSTTTTLDDEDAVLACPFAATPQLVAGLISETKCFITTATYGSAQAYQVKLFRKFREKFLWTNSFGIFLSNTYNKYGPVGANWIYKNPWSKKFVRIGLFPAYWFAYSSLKIGVFLTSVISLLLGLGMFVSLKRLVKIRK